MLKTYVKSHIFDPAAAVEAGENLVSFWSHVVAKVVGITLVVSQLSVNVTRVSAISWPHLAVGNCYFATAETGEARSLRSAECRMERQAQIRTHPA